MRKLFYLLPLCLLTSCGALWEYRSLTELAQFTWEKSNTLTYKGEVSETGTYDVYVLFRHVEGFRFTQMTMDMKMALPDSTLTKAVAIPVRDENGEYLGDGSVDIWDIEHRVYEALPINKGSFEVALSHTMAPQELGLVMEVGIMLKKAKTTSE